MSHTSLATGIKVLQDAERVARLLAQCRVECIELDAELTELRKYHGNDDTATATALGLTQEQWGDVWLLRNQVLSDFIDFLDNAAVATRLRDDDVRRFT